MPFLYEIFDNPFAREALRQVFVPSNIVDNLKYKIRPYQEESFKRYIYLDKNDIEGKPNKPYHLLYNMATGSGKTLVMAGLILYLFEKRYRNFLFFVNSNNIIKKTKDNFLNPQATKYLFSDNSDNIVIDQSQVFIKEVETFEEADNQNINIKFTTIQKLHSDLTTTKENSITYEDFENKKIVLIADEAHHLVAGTRTGNLFGSWENTVKKIHESNFENILLEFTATIDTDTIELVNHYQNKVIQKYDLAQFRIDKYSKEINLIRSDYEEKERIIQALILNLYRQELAIQQNINLKPVILFKAKRTIKESEQNKVKFHKLIDEFSGNMVEKIRNTSKVPIMQKAFLFFNNKGLSNDEIAKRITNNFKEENCLSANNDKEAEKNQILLNTLEDENNPIRAIFAVQKLNEGWDVLNLFDIVRLYDTRDADHKRGKLGKTTISEAQLIGRGARYFPFVLEDKQDKYTRKFDNDATNDLKILEELYYHTKENSRYITELKKALVEIGICEKDVVTKKLILKDSFKKTDFYKTGQVVFNKKIEKRFDNIKSFEDLGVKRKNYRYTLSSGIGKVTMAFNFMEHPISEHEKKGQKDIPLPDIPTHIIRFALSKNPFYHFDKLVRYFPHIKSITNFINDKDYLGGLAITFEGIKNRLSKITNFDYLMTLQGLLKDIETEIKSNLTEYEGSDYVKEYLHKVFKDKEIKVPEKSERANGQEKLVKDKCWYVYNANYGTSEEKSFVKLFARQIENLKNDYKNIYLIRNERALKIIDKLGRAFEPDFLLFCKQKTGKELTYQVFIEPKGNYLKAHDKWKEDFLKEIRCKKEVIKIHSDKYLVTAVPFYNYDNENEFKEAFKKVLEVDN